MRPLFVSHASADHAFAAACCHALEERGYTCWMAPRDVRPGFAWDDEVQAGLELASGLVLILSPRSAVSDIVHREVSLAVTRKLTVLPVRVEQVELSGGLALQLGTTQRLELMGLAPEQVGESVASWAMANLPRPRLPASGASLVRALVALSSPPVSFERRALLDEAAGRMPRPLVLHGLPGSGKTVALRRLAQREARENEQVFAFSFVGPATLQPAFALEALARLADLPGSERDSAEPIALLGRILDTLAGRRTLVLLDRIDEAPEEIRRPLARGFSSCPGVRLLATARQLGPELSALDPVRVPPLDRAEATGFVALHTHAWRLGPASRELLPRLPEPLWSHPASLSLLLAAARELPVKLLLAGVDELPGVEQSQSVIARIIEPVPASTRRVLALTALAEGAGPEQLLGLEGMPGAGELVAELRTLLAAGLLLRRGDAYEVSAVVASALQRLEPELLPEMAQALAEALRASDPALATDRAELFAALAARSLAAEDWAGVAQLARDNLLEALNDGGAWKAYRLILLAGIRAAEARGDLERRLSLGLRLCRKLAQIGRRGDAQAVLAEIEQLAPEPHSELLEAELASHRAILRDRRTEGPLAIQELTESRILRTALGDRRGAAICSKLLGHVHLQEGDVDTAEAEYRKALEEPSLPRRSRAEAELGIATCERRTDRPLDAEARLHRLLDEAGDGRMAASEPRIRYNLAMILEDRGELEDARQQASLGMELAKGLQPGLAAVMGMMLERMTEEVDA